MTKRCSYQNTNPDITLEIVYTENDSLMNADGRTSVVSVDLQKRRRTKSLVTVRVPGTAHTS
jgi:hypothetical protein